MEKSCRDGASISEALDTHTSTLQWHSNTLRGLSSNKQDTCSGRIVTTLTTTYRKRFACDYSGYRVAFMHGIRVHDPPHHLSIGVNIRRWNVAMRPNDDRNLCRIT